MLCKRPRYPKKPLALFRSHVERHGQIDVDDTNRETYRELARAGLMRAAHSFAGSDKSLYKLSKEGFERKAELLGARFVDRVQYFLLD